MPLSIDEQLDSLGLTITEARWHFQIWEALQEQRADPAAVRVMNKYLEFFRSTQAAHFDATIVNSYQLFETRTDTVNFSTLKTALKALEARDIDKEPELVRLQGEIKPLWIKIAHLRNNVVGHYSSAKPQIELFNDSKITPEDIWSFFKLTMALHQGITRPRNRNIEAFNINGKPATVALIDALKKQL